MSNKLYMHDHVQIAGTHRTDYMDLMTSLPGLLRSKRPMECLGVFGTIGSTGQWHTTVHIWEFEGWAGIANDFEYDVNKPGLTNPDEIEWWKNSAAMRFWGRSRILIPASWSPTIDEALAAGIKGQCYEHQVISLQPGSARDFIERVGRVRVPLAARHGIRPVGAWRTALAEDDEVIILWAHPTWDGWGKFEATIDADTEMLKQWRLGDRDIVRTTQTSILFPARDNPLNLGRRI